MTISPNRPSVANTPPAARRPGRPRSADGLTAAQRASRDLDQLLAGKVCSVCPAAATTYVTPIGGISAGRIRQGDRAGDRAALLAAVVEFRCEGHRPVGRPRLGVGNTRSEAVRQCDAALRGRSCTVCGAAASTARTPAGSPAFAALRGGAAPQERTALLTQLSDPRCDAHPLGGRPRVHGDLTSVEHGAALVNETLAGVTCVDPGCDQPATSGITDPGLPNIGQIRRGQRPALAQRALATALLYCTPHTNARTAVGVDPRAGLNADLAAAGGPYHMLRDLAAARGVDELRSAALPDRDAVKAAYALIGVDVEANLAARSAARGKDAPAFVVAAVAFLGDLDAAMESLAAAVSSKDLARRIRGSASGGSVAGAVREFATLGVDVTGYWPQRLLAY